MARIRSIKPEFFDDEDLCALPFQHRLGYEGLWCQADREGRLEDRPKRLKARIFPYDDLDMDALLAELARAGFIIRYIVDGKAYIAIKPSSWQKHQRPRPDEPASQIPTPDVSMAVYAELGPDEALAVSLRKEPQQIERLTDTDAPQILDSDGRVSAECIGKERKGRERKGEGDSAEPSNGSALVPRSPTVMIFPTTGPYGAEWHLSEAQVAEWRQTFPTLDIEAESRKALAWVKANPNKKKTVKGMPRFLLRWFTRAVDSGRGAMIGPNGPQVSKLTMALQRASSGFLESES